MIALELRTDKIIIIFFSQTQESCVSFHREGNKYKLHTEKGEANESPSQAHRTHETTSRYAKLRDTKTTTTSPPLTTLKGQGPES